MNTQKFSSKSLENLLVAIIQLKTDKDLHICIHPEDILQDWVLKQLPMNMQHRLPFGYADVKQEGKACCPVCWSSQIIYETDEKEPGSRWHCMSCQRRGLWKT